MFLSLSPQFSFSGHLSQKVAGLVITEVAKLHGIPSRYTSVRFDVLQDHGFPLDPVEAASAHVTGGRTFFNGRGQAGLPVGLDRLYNVLLP